MTNTIIQESAQGLRNAPLDFQSFAKKMAQAERQSPKYGNTQEDALRTALIALRDAENEIARQRARIHTLESLSITDEVTGLLNRRGFQREMSRALSGSQRRNTQGVLVVIDLDGFKNINDTLGHAAGDAVLLQVARLLHQHVRKTDSVARIGGDEFAILMLDATDALAMQRAHELQTIINSLRAEWDEHVIAVKASVGISALDPNMDLNSLYQAADLAMYQHKQRRKHSVV